MKLITITAMKNEADIVEVFIRYHLQFVDAMVIIDHASNDSSGDTVKRLKESGLPVEYYFSDTIGHNQNHLINTFGKQYLKSNQADWVVPLDMDEFIVAAKNVGVRDIFSQAHPETALQIPWRTYVPTMQNNQAEKVVLNRITTRLKQESRVFYKVAAPASYLRDGTGKISMGNHQLMNARTGKSMDSRVCEDLALAHFSLRSPEQVLGKVLSGWLATLAKGDYGKNEAFHWKRIFDTYCARHQYSYEKMCSDATRLITLSDADAVPELIPDPLVYPLDNNNHISSLKYECDPIATALLTAAAIARELGRLRSDVQPFKWRDTSKAAVLKLKRTLREFLA